ncbi:Vacuolar membrane protease, partial [Lobosporangium transversale]
MDDDDSDSTSNTLGAIGIHQTYPWSNYSLPQLRELCHQRGLLTTGNKAALKKRLKNLDRASKPEGSPAQAATTIQISDSKHTNAAQMKEESELSSLSKGGSLAESKATENFGRSKDNNSNHKKQTHPLRSRISSRSNSFSTHFTEFINRRRIALETERQEISVYTSPLTVLSYFVLYLLHEFRMLLVWIVSQQYLLVALPLLTAVVYFVYQTDGAHQPLLKHAESGLIWYGYWTLLGIASSVGLGTGLHTFILFLGPHIAEVTLAAYKCGNTNFDVRGDQRFICKSSEADVVSLTIYAIFRAVQWESFFWGFGTAIGELPPYFVARAAALSGNRNEELAAIEDLLKKKPDSVSYKERILLM